MLYFKLKVEKRKHNQHSVFKLKSAYPISSAYQTNAYLSGRLLNQQFNQHSFYYFYAV